MDSSTWPELSSSSRRKAIEELIQSQEWSQETFWLEENTHCVEDQAREMFGNSLSFLSNYSVNQVSQTQKYNRSSSNCSDGRKSIATNNIVKTVKNKRRCNIRKRSWTSTIKVTCLIDDGQVWRKYGQKEIANEKHKRNYYRCTHKFEQGCQATKQVQQIEDEPPKYKITYNQHHTCKNSLSTPQLIPDSINLEDTSTFINFKSNKPIDKEQVGSHFPSYTHEEDKEDLSSVGSRDNQPSLFEFGQPHDLPIVDQSGASSMSTWLEYEDVVSEGLYSTIFDIDTVENIDCSENLFDLPLFELTC